MLKQKINCLSIKCLVNFKLYILHKIKYFSVQFYKLMVYNTQIVMLHLKHYNTSQNAIFFKIVVKLVNIYVKIIIPLIMGSGSNWQKEPPPFPSLGSTILNTILLYLV